MGIFSFLFGKSERDRNKELVKESRDSFEKQFGIKLDITDERMEKGGFYTEYTNEWDNFQIWFDVHNYISVAIFNVFEKSNCNTKMGIPHYTSKETVQEGKDGKIIGKFVYKYMSGQWILIEKLSRKQIVGFMNNIGGYSLGDPYGIKKEYDWANENIIAIFPFDNEREFLPRYGVSVDYAWVRS